MFNVRYWYVCVSRSAASTNHYETTDHEYPWLKFLWKVIITRVFSHLYYQEEEDIWIKHLRLRL